MSETKLPTNKEADDLLLWANNLNPGLWIKHSRIVAKIAKAIAQKCNLNYKKAYVLGLLHDIGRYEGRTDLRHILAGYKLMMDKKYNDIANICLTHSFPYKNIKSFVGEIDCTKDEYKFLKNELGKIEYDDYDKLIQLCDALGSADGICLMEVRWIDVIRRRGVNQHLSKKFNETYEIKEYFDNKCGIKILVFFILYLPQSG
ncbi:MAG: HD domain-containing protein [Treponema sp.]|jgi:putative nucleotidyltransferase with HDIG domain|nr:HD domain-containing protein [Treponema sp.]